MKKFALVGSALLLVCVLILPKVVGYKIASSIEEGVEAINAMPEYSAEVISLESGWYATTANIQLTLDTSTLANIVGAQGNENLDLQIVFNASHGPVRWGENSGTGWATWSVDMAGESLREFLDWTQGSFFYHMDGSAGLLGNIDYSHAIQAFTAEMPLENTHVKFSGHQGNYNGSEKVYYSDSNIDVNITTPEGEVSASVNANLVGVAALPASLNDMLEHMLMSGEVNGDKAAIEFMMAGIFEKQYENYKFPRQMSKADITARAAHKMEFFLSILEMEKLFDATGSHYSTALNLNNNQLTIHKKTISLPL